MILVLKRVSLALASAFTVLALAACGAEDTHEKIMKDTVELMTQVADTLESVEDEKTAREAAEELNGLVNEFEKVAERNEAIGTPDNETTTELASIYKNERNEVQARIESSLRQAFNGQSYPTLRESLDRIGEILQTMR